MQSDAGKSPAVMQPEAVTSPRKAKPQKEVTHMKEVLKATVKGVNYEGDTFTTNITFEIIRPQQGARYYGNGCYLKIDIQGDAPQWVDIRYSGAPDLEKLAKQWINNFFGENAKDVNIY